MLRRTFAALLFTLAACEEAPPPRTALTYTADAQKAYDEAMKEFKAHNWIESQALFREVKRKYSYNKVARLAELRIADADFEQDKFTEALRGYKQFIHDHRSDVEEVTYARARAAESQYREISDSILLPSAEERDQAAIIDAYKELQSFLHDFPNGKEVPHVCVLLDDVVARLVRHELYVAQFYLSRDNFPAAVGRIQFAIRSYGGNDACANVTYKGEKPNPDNEFGLIPNAMLLLGETYLKLHKSSDARTTFGVIVQRYPRSSIVGQAQRYIDWMTKGPT